MNTLYPHMMTRYLLVPENMDLNSIKKVQLPSNIVVPATAMSNPPQDEDPPREDKKVKGKKLRSDLACYTVNTSLAKKLMRFLHQHQFNVNNAGQLIYQGRKYPLILEDHFRDLVDGGTRRPKGHELLYKLLKSAG